MGEGGAVGPHQPQGAGRGLHHQPHIAVERQPLLAQTTAAGHAAQRGLRGDQGGQGGELPARTGGIGLEPHLGGLQVQGPGRLQAAASQHLQHRGGGEGEGAVAGQLTRHRHGPSHRQGGGGVGRRVQIQEALQGQTPEGTARPVVGLENGPAQIGAAAVDQQLTIRRADRRTAGEQPGLPQERHIAAEGRGRQVGGLHRASHRHRTAHQGHGAGAQLHLGHQLSHHPVQGGIQIQVDGNTGLGCLGGGRQGQGVAVEGNHVVDPAIDQRQQRPLPHAVEAHLAAGGQAVARPDQLVAAYCGRQDGEG